MTSFGANPVETVLGGDVALLDAVVEGFYGAGDAQRVRFYVDCARCGSRVASSRGHERSTTADGRRRMGKGRSVSNARCGETNDATTGESRGEGCTRVGGRVEEKR